MGFQDQIRNLIRIALRTSPVMGVLVSMPTFKHISFSLQVFLLTTLFTCFFALSIWAFNILLVFFVEKFSLHKYGNNLRYLISYLLIISFSFISWTLIKGLIFSDFDILKPVYTESHDGDIHFPLVVGFFLNTIILIIQEIALLKDKRTMVELENAQLKTKNAEAFYQQLKQQIHPHFLFNSLNILKTLIKKDQDVAVDYVVKLSDFLRASISANNANTVKLDEELKLCLDYLEMQKLRFGKALEYTFEVPENIKFSGYVPAFSLQLLLENAIKHNSLTIESPLQIKLFYHEELITVTNNIQPKSTTEDSTGLGLNNLSERYKMLSGNDIKIEANENEFSVSIKILDQ
jgi:two-component system, LytTR family, sensor kinase